MSTTVAEFAQKLREDKAELRELIARLEKLGVTVDAETMVLLRREVSRHCKTKADFLAFVGGLMEGLEETLE